MGRGCRVWGLRSGRDREKARVPEKSGSAKERNITRGIEIRTWTREG